MAWEYVVVCAMYTGNGLRKTVFSYVLLSVSYFPCGWVCVDSVMCPRLKLSTTVDGRCFSAFFRLWLTTNMDTEINLLFSLFMTQALDYTRKQAYIHGIIFNPPKYEKRR